MLLIKKKINSMNAQGFATKKTVAVILVVAIVVGGGLYIHYHHKNATMAAAAATKVKVVGATSKPTTHQATTNNGVVQGGVTNTNGSASSDSSTSPSSSSASSLPPESEWTKSSSGDITLQTPVANQTLASGDSLIGLADVSSVQFVLSDNSVGQIAEGTLPVSGGKFSGTLQFTPHASTGKLEVYYPNPSNGAEEDVISIDVNFDVQ
jgi:hypothetical protein